jgi:hypothetical protein
MKFEIYIDNKKLVMRRKNFKSIGIAIAEANKILMKEEKVISEILVNGELFSEDKFGFYQDGIIEIKTRGHENIMLESIHNVVERGHRFFELAEEIEYCEPNSIELAKHIGEQLSLVGWFFNVMIALKRHGFETLGELSLEEFIDDLKEEQKYLKDAFSQGDELSVLEILEFEISSIIGDFMEAVNQNLPNIREEYRKSTILC